MKKCLRYIFIVIMLVMAIGSHKVLAGQIEKVTANVNDSGQVTIKGNISGGKGKVVNVKVVDDKGILNYADTTISGTTKHFCSLINCQKTVTEIFMLW